MFPKVPDQHKPNSPLIPNGLGVTYILFTTVYLFLVYFFSSTVQSSNSGFAPVSAPLTLAVCVLFGGFMGLLDDWMDLKWRYKAFMPLIAALPLIYYALANPTLVRTSIALPFFGTISFDGAYFFLIIPLIVMIVTNTINMLGGLNGLETIVPATVLAGLMILSGAYVLMLGPLIFWLILAALNVQGKLFVGNSGSFAIGMTIASFAIITDLKLPLVISILPYIFNSVLILLSVFFAGGKAKMTFDGKKLTSNHRRSLVTLITYKRPLTERQVVAIISILSVLFTALAMIISVLNIF